MSEELKPGEVGEVKDTMESLDPSFPRPTDEELLNRFHQLTDANADFIYNTMESFINAQGFGENCKEFIDNVYEVGGKFFKKTKTE